MKDVAHDSDEYSLESDGQRWICSWHHGETAPDGKNHGAAGICLSASGQVVLVSLDGVTWSFPAGRPEIGESIAQTLHRELLEEACAIVTDARLLGFSRGRCIEGAEAGLVLVRSIWLARVRLLEFEPRFETQFRQLADVRVALDCAGEYRPTWERAFRAAGLI
jgi:8-oxo-dGTP pyrophosphatase MutT (NUDIX family)